MTGWSTTIWAARARLFIERQENFEKNQWIQLRVLTKSVRKAKSEIQRVFSILTEETKIFKKSAIQKGLRILLYISLIPGIINGKKNC